MLEFEPYHVHTSYSNCLTQPDSTMSIEDYAKVYKERGHHILCMSEHGNRSNVWQQFELANKYSDENFRMTPLAAAETYFVPDRTTKEHRGYHLVLVAKNMDGFYQLNEILSEANLTGFYYHARVDFELLRQLNYKDFICTTACVAGPSDETMLIELRNIFRENFYLEIQGHPQEVQVDRNKWMIELSKKHKWPLIYATDSHYINKEDKELRRELLLASKITYGSEDEFILYLPTAEEALEMLKVQGVLNRAQIQEAMDNTLILREFEGVHFTTEKKIPNPYPDMPLDRRNYLYKKTVCDEYIRKAGMPSKEEAAEIHAEMDTMTSTGTADYPLIMKRIIDKGIEYGGVLTKTGRGSGASFVSNYAMGFSSISRLKVPVKMYPERFISADRLANGLPDLDCNMANVEAFEKAGKEILGEYGCLPMIAYGTAKTLSAFKLLARARDASAQIWAETDEKALELKRKIEKYEKNQLEGYGNNADLNGVKKEPYYLEYEKLLEEHGSIPFAKANEIAKQIQNYEMDVKHARENNADDPDYDVDDDVRIESYVEDKYLELIEASKKYKGIITSLSPHPCANVLSDKDLRREIGIVRVKSKSGSKDAVYAAYIDGKTADSYNYLKADFLRVDVVKVISDTFKLAGLPVMSVDELLEAVKDDKEVWNLYANGFVMGLNQVERAKSAERCRIYKPRNVTELAAFIAAIRPGFKSMLSTFINRQKFSYNIPSLDNLLATKEIPDSFLLYDEQILRILKAAGIPGADAYACTKSIKKKKADKVASYKERFKEGFTKVLQEQEGASEEKAHKTVEQIWRIIEDAANYMFCAAHAFSMACDSLYAAWLKVHYPYELYITMLKLYDEKKNTDKISAIIAEMKRYKNIALTAGRFGQDNRDWVVDKEHHCISQSLSSIRYMSKGAARDLFTAGQKEYKTFTDVLRELQMNTCLDTRQIKILIELNYFEQFGKSGKLIKVFDEFFEGSNKLTKTVKSFESRLENCRKFEESLPDEELSIGQRLDSELSNIGLCLSIDKSAPDNLYFVREIDAKYGIKSKLYSIQRGTTGIIRFRKDDYAKKDFKEGDCVQLLKFNQSPRYTYKGGAKTAIPNEYEFWAKDYKVISAPNRK